MLVRNIYRSIIYWNCYDAGEISFCDNIAETIGQMLQRYEHNVEYVVINVLRIHEYDIANTATNVLKRR